MDLFQTKQKKNAVLLVCFPSSLALIKYIRPVFVSRSDQDSRRKTVEEIKRRAQSDGKWPQVLYAPTGCQMVFGILRLQIGSFLHFLAGCFRWFVGGEVLPSFWKIKHKILIYTQKKK